MPSINELDKIFHLHQVCKFDTFPDAIFPQLAQIVDNCFSISYQSGAELLLDLEEANSGLKELRRCVSYIFPYISYLPY